MRERLCHTLAQHMGKTLTQELAVMLVRELFPRLAHEPEKFGSKVYKGYSFQCERLAAVLPELHKMHERHYAETEAHRSGIQMNPDYNGMIEREHAGELLQFTAREISTGALVGNMRVYIGKSAHTSTLFCTEDTFFVVPEHRGGFMAVRLWQFAEGAVRSIGVREARFDSKLVNKADKMALYLKYTPVATKFVKLFPPYENPAQERSHIRSDP